LKKRSKAELTVNGIGTVVVVAIVGAVLSTPFYGLGPALVVSGGLLAGAWTLRVLGGDAGKRRR
jgi:hypothetical protein